MPAEGRRRPQHDNRNGEPNLHVHKVLLNRAVRDDRATSGDVQWRALYGKAPSVAERP